jgi:pantothenate kinase
MLTAEDDGAPAAAASPRPPPPPPRRARALSESAAAPAAGIDATGATISAEWPAPADGPDGDGDSSSGGASGGAALPRAKDAPAILLPHQSRYVSHIALDIGGSLAKLVYFTRDERESGGGKLHFVKFETSRLDECAAFIEAKGLHRRNGSALPMRVKATGGGSLKHAALFAERLGLILEHEDEMGCLVDGCNFLLKAVAREAFTYEAGAMRFVDLDPSAAFPYLLVNIGSGVSMVRVDGEGRHQRVSGTNIGGGTFWGLARLLTGLTDFDEILQLSTRGDNSAVDLLVGDIYGGRDYTAIGLSASTIASSFGKAVAADRELAAYDPADVALSLCRMISYNIGQLACLNAARYGLKRVFFGGFFIRNNPYTMETISFAIRFWSRGELAATFLRHEGYLGAVGAFMRVREAGGVQGAAGSAAGKVRARFVERFAVGAPVAGGRVTGPPMAGVGDKTAWVEKFMSAGAPATEAAKREHERAEAARAAGGEPGTPSRPPSAGDLASPAASGATAAASARSMDLNVGVLHFTPSLEPFPLLADPAHYEPNTLDINADAAEREYWAGVLADQIPTVVEKAAASAGGGRDAARRAAAFGRAFELHLARLREEPGRYGNLGLAELFELREVCLREFGFEDVYAVDKARESAAALEVLPDLLAELDALPLPERALTLVHGALAANIFDWGAKATVSLYQSATIMEMYREARGKLSRRPWRVDDFDAFAARLLARSELDAEGRGALRSPYKRAIVFVDNAGADVVLGMLPLVRELLRGGCEVVLAANSLPAINDVTAAELRSVVARAAEACPLLRAAIDAAAAAEEAAGGRVPPLAGLSRRVASAGNLAALAAGASGADEGGDAAAALQRLRLRDVAAGPASPRRSPPARSAPRGPFGEPYPSPWRDPRLYVVASGSGSPCLDLRRVSSDLADATVGADLVIIEGMGRAVHTNYSARMACDSLKLAMIKNAHLAARLFGGEVYDCVCRFDEGSSGAGPSGAAPPAAPPVGL